MIYKSINYHFNYIILLMNIFFFIIWKMTINLKESIFHTILLSDYNIYNLI